MDNIPPNTCRPALAYRVMAWGGLALFIFLLVMMINEESFGTGQPKNAPLWLEISLLLVLLAFIGGSAWLVNEAMAAYNWDEDRLIRRDLLGEKSVLWNEVDHCKISSDLTYNLHDRRGTRLRINFPLLQGEFSPLYDVASKKLAQITMESYGDPHPEIPMTFHQKKFGIETQSITLETGQLVHRKGFTQQVIPYDRVKYVITELMIHQGIRGWETRVFSDGERELFALRSTYKDFGKIIFHIKSRLTHAKWLEPGTLLELDDVLVIIRRDLDKVSRVIKERTWIGLYIMILCMIYLYLSNKLYVPQSKGIPFAHNAAVIFAIIAIFPIYHQFKLRRMKKALSQKIGELESKRITS